MRSVRTIGGAGDYCGGTASAVFGQAQGGGLVRAADQNGFIMVVPSSGRCWDVQSNQTRTRDGMGDSHAIAQMVRYALQTRNANAQRVYATGDSSGGMMTELLLAVYPDIFKALATTPTSSTTVTLGTHQATRQSWRNACGYTVLEAFASMGGDHGPSDALFLSQYVVPFLGLDTAGAVDPEIAQCGMSGAGGAGGSGPGGTAGRSGCVTA